MSSTVPRPASARSRKAPRSFNLDRYARSLSAVAADPARARYPELPPGALDGNNSDLQVYVIAADRLLVQDDCAGVIYEATITRTVRVFK